MTHIIHKIGITIKIHKINRNLFSDYLLPINNYYDREK